MTAALTSPAAQDVPSSVAVLRRQAALARALLDELDRALPATRACGRAEVIDAQFVEEPTRLGCRVLECAATTVRTPTHSGAPRRGRDAR
jgi:hypothetical protein